MDELLAHMMPDNVVLHHPAISPFSPRLPRHRRTDSALRGILYSMAARKSLINPGSPSRAAHGAGPTNRHQMD
jgi:hypothetical protein